MQKNLVLIDIDGMFYHACRDTLEDSIETFKEKLDNCLIQTNAYYWAGFVTKGKCFRYNIDKNYKANRKKAVRPKWLNVLKEWAIAEYDLVICNTHEADDAVMYWMNKNLYLSIPPIGESYITDVQEGDWSHVEFNKILCSPDKDLLYNLPGKHFNYTYYLEDKKKPESLVKGTWVETSEEESNYFKLKQLMIGDVSDNIKTPFPESAGDWFVKNKMNFNDVVSAYILGFNYETKTGMKKFVKGMGTTVGLIELAKNYRLLHLLESDEDFIREVGKVPWFPIISKVLKEEEIKF